MDELLASLLSVMRSEQQHFLPLSQLAAAPLSPSHFQEMKFCFFLHASFNSLFLVASICAKGVEMTPPTPTPTPSVSSPVQRGLHSSTYLDPSWGKLCGIHCQPDPDLQRGTPHFPLQQGTVGLTGWCEELAGAQPARASPPSGPGGGLRKKELLFLKTKPAEIFQSSRGFCLS